jgi:uncharacterized SAM-binding protein YcdF (DUF218 family)
MDQLLRFFANDFWVQRGEEIPYAKADIIVGIGYSMGMKGVLARGSASVFRQVALRFEREPQAKVVFGVFDHHQWFIDQKLKRRALQSCGISTARTIELGPVSSTISEAKRARQVLDEKGIKPHNIVIVTGVSHSRTCYMIWRKFFRSARIEIVAIPIEDEIDKDDVVANQRSAWRWFAVNIARHVIFRIVLLFFPSRGMRWLSLIRQPEAKPT